MNYYATTHAKRINPLSTDFEIIHYIDNNFDDVAYHYHDFYEIYVYISGDITYHANGVIYNMRQGDIVLLNNKTLHKMSRSLDVKETRYERKVILIDPDFVNNNVIAGRSLANCFERNFEAKSHLLRFKKDERDKLQEILDRLEAAYYGHEAGDEVLKVVYLIELLVFFNKAQVSSEDKSKYLDICSDSEISDILDYFDRNIEGDLSLNSISEEFCLEKHYLIRKFKKRMGMAPHQYIKKMRLVKARDLLKKDISVTDVCYQCGFNDYSNFIRSFTSEFGISPKKFTKFHLSKK